MIAESVCAGFFMSLYIGERALPSIKSVYVNVVGL